MTSPLADMVVGPLGAVLHRAFFRDDRVQTRHELISITSGNGCIRTAYPEQLPPDFLSDGLMVDTPSNVVVRAENVGRDERGFWVVAHIFEDAVSGGSIEP